MTGKVLAPILRSPLKNLLLYCRSVRLQVKSFCVCNRHKRGGEVWSESEGCKIGTRPTKKRRVRAVPNPGKNAPAKRALLRITPSTLQFTIFTVHFLFHVYVLPKSLRFQQVALFFSQGRGISKRNQVEMPKSLVISNPTCLRFELTAIGIIATSSALSTLNDLVAIWWRSRWRSVICAAVRFDKIAAAAVWRFGF